MSQIRPYTVEANEDNVRRALAISDLTSEEATVGVFWTGTIPYYTERKAIDFLGKSDPYIAGLQPDLSEAASGIGMFSVPGHNKHDLTYSIQELQPTYIQNVRWKRPDLSQWAEVHYEEVTAYGVKLFLLSDSEQVKWYRTANN